MSYIHTVTIMSNLTKTYVEENISIVYETIYNKIASVTGWETSASGLLVGTGSKQLRINISLLMSGYKFAYSIHSQNDNGNVYLDNPGINNTSITDGCTLYLHYCKSKSGKTVAIGLSTYTTPTIDFIIAEDVNGDFSGIGLRVTTNNTYWGAQMVWNGYKCNLSGTKVGGSSSSNNSSLQPVINASISTSVCKMPNFLSGVMFKELFMILSLPINLTQLNSVVLDIEGKKYQGCYEYTNTDSSSIKENGNALAILAG